MAATRLMNARPRRVVLLCEVERVRAMRIKVTPKSGICGLNQAILILLQGFGGDTRLQMPSDHGDSLSVAGDTTDVASAPSSE